MSQWPILGRFVQIAIALIRLPELRSSFLEFSTSKYFLATQQLPILVQTITELNRLKVKDAEFKQNFEMSVPKALRKLTRDLSSIEHKLTTVTESITYLPQKVEHIRRELMYEMLFRFYRNAIFGNPLKVTTKIINQEKLKLARSDKLRLNLGCSNVFLENYINVDRRTQPGVDIISEVDELPFQANEIDEILSAHLIEHFPQEQIRKQLLPYWLSILKPGGKLRLVVMNAEEIMKDHISSECPFDTIRDVIVGDQYVMGNFHFTMFSPESLTALLKEVGFINITLIAQNDGLREFEIAATRELS